MKKVKVRVVDNFIKLIEGYILIVEIVENILKILTISLKIKDYHRSILVKG